MLLFFLKATFISIGLFLIFLLLLRKSTSFHFKRFFLLGILVLSVTLPLISFNVDLNLKENTILTEGSQLISKITAVGSNNEHNNLDKPNSDRYSIWLFTFYFSICIALFLKTIINSRLLYSKHNEKGATFDGMKLYYLKNDSAIFSFFNRLYLPTKYKNERLDSSIFTHEKTHCKQYHSIDNLLSDLYALIFWFNPISWFIKKSIRNNHEHLADFEAVQETEQTTYMQTIINHITKPNQPLLSSSFSFLSIKSRFNMLQKQQDSKSKAIFSIGTTLLLSICLISLFAFKPNQIEKTIDYPLSTGTGLNVYNFPSGFPMKIDNIQKISSEFGMRIHPITKEEQLHKGVDLIANEGTNILATANGQVITSKFSKNYGNHIIIQHSSKYKTLYAHLKSLNVQAGDDVKLGQEIGIIGNSGKSIKTHLHYEVLEFDTPVDPKIIFNN